MYRPNQRIRISAAAGIVIGRIEHIAKPDEMPDLPGMPAADVREVLTEWGVTRVAMISYYTSPENQFLFWALEIDGRWFDLKRQELELEVVGYYSCANASLN